MHSTRYGRQREVLCAAIVPPSMVALSFLAVSLVRAGLLFALLRSQHFMIPLCCNDSTVELPQQARFHSPGGLAQLVRRWTRNPKVRGSAPRFATLLQAFCSAA